MQRQLLLNQARIISETMDAADNTIGELITTLNLTEKIYPKLGNVKWPFEHIKENIYAVGMIASPKKSVDKHFTSGKAFRADDAYRGGDIGLPLGAKADIMTPWEHVRRPSAGETSIFTSVSGTRSKSLKFTKKGKIYTILSDELKKLEVEGKLKIYTPNSVKELMKNSGNKRIKKDANNVFEIMKKNDEILIEGVIPESIIKI